MMSNSEEKSTKTTTKEAEMRLTIPATSTKPKQTLLALVDSGTSSSLCNYDRVHKRIQNKERRRTKWSTQGGELSIFFKATIDNL